MEEKRMYSVYLSPSNVDELDRIAKVLNKSRSATLDFVLSAMVSGSPMTIVQMFADQISKKSSEAESVDSKAAQLV